MNPLRAIFGVGLWSALAACSSLSTDGKTACRSQGDCLDGYKCVRRVCVMPEDAGGPGDVRASGGSQGVEAGASGQSGSGGMGGDGSGNGGMGGSGSGGMDGGGSGNGGFDGVTDGGGGASGGAASGGGGGGGAAAQDASDGRATDGGDAGGPLPECGNGHREAGEACDDGKTSAQDGCSADCTAVEAGFYCIESAQGLSTCAACGPIFVDQATRAPKPDGKSWTTAHYDLAAALQQASDLVAPSKCNRVEVWVADGTYTPGPDGSRDVSFKLVDGVEIYGGFSGAETTRDQRDWTKHVATLTGDLRRDDTVNGGGSSDNAYHVVTAQFTDNRAVLDGFTVEGGRADGGFPSYDGAGIYLKSSDARLAHLIVQRNFAAQDGGGIYVDQGAPELLQITVQNDGAARGAGIYHHRSTPKLREVTVFRCYASRDGAGIYNEASDADIADSVIQENDVHNSDSDAHGGGMYDVDSNPRVRGTRFDGNVAWGTASHDGFGGGVYNTNSNPKMTDCSITGNQTGGTNAAYGGGMCNMNGSHVVLVRTGVSANYAMAGFGSGQASAYGGGLSNQGSSLECVSCGFYDNKVSSATVLKGPSVYNEDSDASFVDASFGQYYGGPSIYADSGTLKVVNATFNLDGIYGPGPATVINSIVWGGAGLAGADVKYSCVEKGGYDETNPLETNRDDCIESGNGLAEGSPGIDQGSTSALPADAQDVDGDGNVTEPLPLDLGGLPRVVGAAVDMGAFESQ